MAIIFITPGGGEGLERGRQRYKRNTFSIQKPESLPGEEPTSGKVVSKNATGTCEDKPVRPIFIELINDGEKDVPQQVQTPTEIHSKMRLQNLKSFSGR